MFLLNSSDVSLTAPCMESDRTNDAFTDFFGWDRVGAHLTAEQEPTQSGSVTCSTVVCRWGHNRNLFVRLSRLSKGKASLGGNTKAGLYMLSQDIASVLIVLLSSV